MLLASAQARADVDELQEALAKHLVEGEQHTSFKDLDRLLKGVHNAVGQLCEVCIAVRLTSSSAISFLGSDSEDCPPTPPYRC